MLAEGLKALIGLANEAESIRRVPMPLDASRNTTVVAHGGVITTLPHDPPARSHLAKDQEAFVAYATENSAIWHCDNKAVLVIDDADDGHRDSQVVWEMESSDKWLALFDASVPRQHDAFVNFLLTNLRDEIDSASPGLIGTVRQMKFRTVDESEIKVLHGRESMGRSIEQELAGGKDLPESFTLLIRRWATVDVRVEIECMLKLDVANRLLAIVPLADQLSLAERVAHEVLGERLAEAADCPVYYGSPLHSNNPTPRSTP